jgi:BolA protein
MTTIADIKAALSPLQPLHIEIEDDSHLHAGHAGNMGGGHYRLTIVSRAFEGLSHVKRHQLVFQHVDALMGSAIHALSIRAQTPVEYSQP